MLSELNFDEENHVYTLRGRRLQSVTGILNSAGIIDTTWFNESARIRGTYVHKAIHLYLKNELDFDSLDSVVVPYFNAFLKFLKEVKPEIIGSELRVLNLRDDYAGTLDLLLKLPGCKTIDLVDIKTGSLSAWTALQLVGYIRAENEMGVVAGMRAGLQLMENGNYNYKTYTNPADHGVWDACRIVANYKHKGNK